MQKETNILQQTFLVLWCLLNVTHMQNINTETSFWFVVSIHQI